MTTNSGCEGVRPRLMAAALDGETDAASPADREHLAACSSCRQWLTDLELMNERLQRLAYPAARLDLWPSLESTIREADATANATRRLWIIGALVLAWRALQLAIDLPLPVLHPLVPLAAAAAALWLLAGDALSIKTFAPELQKRGI